MNRQQRDREYGFRQEMTGRVKNEPQTSLALLGLHPKYIGESGLRRG